MHGYFGTGRLDTRDILRCHVEDEGWQDCAQDSRGWSSEMRNENMGLRVFVGFLLFFCLPSFPFSRGSEEARTDGRGGTAGGTWHASGIRDRPLKPARVDTK